MIPILLKFLFIYIPCKLKQIIYKGSRCDQFAKSYSVGAKDIFMFTEHLPSSFRAWLEEWLFVSACHVFVIASVYVSTRTLYQLFKMSIEESCQKN